MKTVYTRERGSVIKVVRILAGKMQDPAAEKDSQFFNVIRKKRNLTKCHYNLTMETEISMCIKSVCNHCAHRCLIICPSGFRCFSYLSFFFFYPYEKQKSDYRKKARKTISERCHYHPVVALYQKIGGFYDMKSNIHQKSRVDHSGRQCEELVITEQVNS